MEYWLWKHLHWLWWTWVSILQVTWYKYYNWRRLKFEEAACQYCREHGWIEPS